MCTRENSISFELKTVLWHFLRHLNVPTRVHVWVHATCDWFVCFLVYEMRIRFDYIEFLLKNYCVRQTSFIFIFYQNDRKHCELWITIHYLDNELLFCWKYCDLNKYVASLVSVIRFFSSIFYAPEITVKPLQNNEERRKSHLLWNRTMRSDKLGFVSKFSIEWFSWIKNRNRIENSH